MVRIQKFTIIELLIVVAIIGVLMSLLQPSLSNVLENSRHLQCQTQLKHIGIAFSLFAADQNNHLPGSVQDNWNSDPARHSWLGSETGYRDNDPGKRMRGAKRVGSIWPYLDKTHNVSIYRCPSLEEGIWNSGIGSNGLFDYVSFKAFSGAKIDYMPSKAYYPVANNDQALNLRIDEMDSSLTPLVGEEDPYWWLNRNFIEPAHANLDRMGNWHGNGTNIVAHDGSAQHIEFTYRGPYAREWKVKGPSGQVYGLGGGGWGDWNKR